MTADSFAPPSDRPAPTFPDLAAASVMLLADIASTLRRLEAAAVAVKPARKPAAPPVEALSERILSSLSNPFTTGDVRCWTTWGALRRDFGLTPHQRRALSEFWRKNAIVETRPGKGIRIVG